MKILLDISPLRSSPAFARLWLGTAVSGIGGQLSSYAILLQSWEITHSAFAVGGVGLSIGVPRILFALFGGALSDFTDRRRLVLLTTVGLIAGSTVLTAQSALHLNEIWVLYVVAATKAALSAIAGPARVTFTPSLLDAREVAAGLALNQVSSEWSVFAGPMLAGWLVGWSGFTICFLIDTLSYLASLYGVFRLPELRGAARKRPGWSAMPDGMRHIAAKPAVLGVLLADLSAIVLAYPSALLPVLNSTHFGGRADTLGYMLSAMALGGIVSSLFSGAVTGHRRPGLLVLGSAAVWGGALGLVGLTGSLWLMLGLLLMAGAADTISVTARGIVVQMSTEDEYRGRVTAVSQSIGVAGPALGNFRAGAVASLVGPEAAIVLGGLTSLACVAAIYRFIPGVRRYTTVEQEAGTC
jgi:MFS family permease